MSDGNQLPQAGETACPTYFAKRLIQQGGAGGFACHSNASPATFRQKFEENRLLTGAARNRRRAFTACNRAATVQGAVGDDILRWTVTRSGIFTPSPFTPFRRIRPG